MRIALFGLAAGLGVVAGQASPMCQQDTLAHYEGLAPGPSGGCMVGPLTFHDFQFNLLDMAGGAVPVSASDVTVTPSSGPYSFGLTFSSGGFSVFSGQFIEYLLNYTVDPPPPIIHGYGLDMDVDGPTAPGSDTITSAACLDAAFSQSSLTAAALIPVPTCPTSTVTQTVFDNGVTSKLHSAVTFPKDLVTLGDLTTIALDARAGGTANFRSFTQSALTAPEPALGLFTGALALALIGIRRRLAR